MRMLLIIALALCTGWGLSACGSEQPSVTPPPSGEELAAQPTPEQGNQLEVYPEQGYVGSVVEEAPDGTLVCGDDAATDLVIGGTVTQSGTNITAMPDEDGLTITFEGAAYVRALIVNGTTIAVVPEEFFYVAGLELRLAAVNYGGKFTSITVCGGGA